MRWFAMGVSLVLAVELRAADPSPSAPPAAPPAAAPAAGRPTPTGLAPLNKEQTVFLDRAGKRLVLKAEVVLRAGLLEMLLCKAHTKEHESILAIKADAFVIHGGLLALGAQPGTPVRYDPVFRPPTGQPIKIILRWQDPSGKTHEVPAQTWIRHSIHRYFSWPLEKLPEDFELPSESELRYDEFNKLLLWYGPMTAVQREELLKQSSDPEYRKAIQHFFEASQSRELTAGWVFAGSGFYDLGDGTRRYQAEDGNVICVANFGDAMIDLSIPSTASNEGLEFEPYTERIPPLGTPVEVDLIPVFDPPRESAPPQPSR